MNKQISLVLSLSFLCLLTSCEDVSSNRRQGQNRNPERDRPEIGSEGSENLRSHIHRERGSSILSYAEEIQKTLGRDLPVISYRIIPLMEKDDEGSAKNVATVNDLGRPMANCGRGDGFAGIDSRITDCFQKNDEKALWEGYRYGAAGESTWKLVTKNDSKEMWLDLRTGMVWSNLRADSEGKNLFNWCKASGNDQNSSTELSVDCNALAEGESVCAGELLEEVGSQIQWRLPTRNDYLQADINGIRFIFPKEDDRGLWTATMRAASEGRGEAWVYSTKEGTLSGAPLATERFVRCIGAPVR